MDQIYDQSFTPWETPLFQDKCNNYLKSPPQKKKQNIFKQFDNICFLKPWKKQKSHQFVNRSRITSKNTVKQVSIKQIKQNQRSLHFQDVFSAQKNKKENQIAKHQTFNTIISIVKKRKSLKNKIEKTKQLLLKNQQNQHIQKSSKSNEEIQIKESLQKLLSLHKTTSHFNLSNFSNTTIKSSTSPSLDCIFQSRETISLKNRGKNATNGCGWYKQKKKSHEKSKKVENQNQLESKFQVSLQKEDIVKSTVNMRSSKCQMKSLKRSIYNKTFYKSSKYQKSMNLPKIQILDWQKPQL